MKGTKNEAETAEREKKANPLRRIRRSLRDKLRQTHAMIGQYEETMDYATHCSLQGFFEGLDFALEEVETLLREEAEPRKLKSNEGKRGE